ncbi:MAG: lysylphosphatidylglycerol synthase transmembrane domain-containing protein [Candidatus Saccharimonas sp.]
MGKKISFRAKLSIITFVLIALILYLTRHELVHAWNLLQQVNIWLLLLVFPASAISYLAGGEMIFSYLRQKGFVKDVSPLTLMRISLELNFVNHAFPSGGVSGISYTNWRLGKYGISNGRATMAQIVRYAMGFVALVVFLAVAMIWVTADGAVNRWIILMSAILVGATLAVSFAGMFFLDSKRRLAKASQYLTSFVNTFGRRVLRRKKPLLRDGVVLGFFDDMHEDFMELKQDKKLLIKPFVWGLVFVIMEIVPFWMTFKALGVDVNPASILIGYGAAIVTGFFFATPGGAGAYEAVMVAVLTISGVGQGQAIAGTVLYRVIALLTTLVLGYVFYQLTILKYGRQPTSHPRS